MGLALILRAMHRAGFFRRGLLAVLITIGNSVAAAAIAMGGGSARVFDRVEHGFAVPAATPAQAGAAGGAVCTAMTSSGKSH